MNLNAFNVEASPHPRKAIGTPGIRWKFISAVFAIKPLKADQSAGSKI
jgi:hypothetical protein